MVSTLKVNTLQRQSGTTITIGESGDTITITSGATLSGSGASLTLLTATNISSGTIPDGRFPGTLPAASGTNLTALNAGSISSGSVPDANISASSVSQHTSADINQIQNNIALLGFKTAVNGSLAKYSLVNQIVDEYEDSSGIDGGASTNDSLVSGYYTGMIISTGNATGGTITDVGLYKVHSFLTGTTTFTPPYPGDVDSLLVAGGGGGAGCGGGPGGGGGGGAGGMLVTTGTSLLAQAYSIVIGTGGAGATGTANGSDGVDTTGLGLTAVGGGGGATGAHNDGNDGGSGGGGAYGPAYGQGGAGTASQGNDGGQGGGSDGYGGGGGGGAGAVGGDGTAATVTPSVGGNGGNGLDNNYRTGSNVNYAGGGGGGLCCTGGTPGTGGSGGGGAAGAWPGPNDGADGSDNLGGGAGGCSDGGTGGAGGTGIAVIRYLADSAFSESSGGNMTLISTATTSESAPGEADFISLMEDGTGTAILNTDIKGYVSRDNGTTYTQGTLVDQGEWGTNKTIVAFHDLDISAQPSGTSMRYKIETLNQSVSKQTKIHATSIGWK